jgi:hypothetical protein
MSDFENEASTVQERTKKLLEGFEQMGAEALNKAITIRKLTNSMDKWARYSAHQELEECLDKVVNYYIEAKEGVFPPEVVDILYPAIAAIGATLSNLNSAPQIVSAVPEEEIIDAEIVSEEIDTVELTEKDIIWESYYN